MKTENQSDLEFMQEVRKASDSHLGMLLRFQACEHWREIAILREMERRRSAR